MGPVKASPDLLGSYQGFTPASSLEWALREAQTQTKWGAQKRQEKRQEKRGDGWRWRYWYAYGDLFQVEQDEGYEVEMLDNLSHGAPNTTSVQDTFFSQYPCDRLMHFAALTHVRKSAWNWTVQNDSPRDLVAQEK